MTWAPGRALGTALRAVHPFDGSPPDRCSRLAEARSWITDPPGMVNEFAPGVFVTAELARYVIDEVEAEMKRRWPSARRFVYVHDLSRISGYAPEARRLLTDWGLARREEAERVVIVTSPTNALVRMGISTATAVLRAAGMNIEVADALAPVLLRERLRPAGR